MKFRKRRGNSIVRPDQACPQDRKLNPPTPARYRSQHKPLLPILLAVAALLLLFLTLETRMPNAMAARQKTETEQEYQMRQRMLAISAQIGVTCVYCHNLKNFQEAASPAYNIGKEHMRITDWLNSAQGLKGSPAIDCFHCHRGEAKPKIAMPKWEH